MKIRIRANSLRLRLTQSEVNTFGEKGEVRDQIQFGLLPKETLTYSMVLAKGGELRATYEDRRIRVQVPGKMAKDWVETDLIGMTNDMELGNEKVLKILVEKDFKCLTARHGEDETDNFPHP